VSDIEDLRNKVEKALNQHEHHASVVAGLVLGNHLPEAREYAVEKYAPAKAALDAARAERDAYLPERRAAL
jgi:hypothetical protein